MTVTICSFSDFKKSKLHLLLRGKITDELNYIVTTLKKTEFRFQRVNILYCKVRRDCKMLQWINYTSNSRIKTTFGHSLEQHFINFLRAKLAFHYTCSRLSVCYVTIRSFRFIFSHVYSSFLVITSKNLVAATCCPTVY